MPCSPIWQETPDSKPVQCGFESHHGNQSFGPVLQLAEGTGLNPAQCGFDAHRGYQVIMRNPQKGNRVEIMTGKHQGQIGTVIGLEANGRALVQLPGLPYERSYAKEHLEFRGRGEQQLSTGESRRKRMQAMVAQGKMCPSYPHSCSGECGIKQDD